MTKIKEGQLAIDFTLPDQNGKLHKLSDYKGKWILLYFYPKDDTPGCIKEACVIRDAFPNFKKLKRNTKQHENKNTSNNTKYNFRVFSCVLKILVLFSVYAMRKKKSLKNMEFGVKKLLWVDLIWEQKEHLF